MGLEIIFILQLGLHLDYVWFPQFNRCRYSLPSQQDQKYEMDLKDQLQHQFWVNWLQDESESESFTDGVSLHDQYFDSLAIYQHSRGSL